MLRRKIEARKVFPARGEEIRGSGLWVKKKKSSVTAAKDLSWPREKKKATATASSSEED